MRRFSLWLLAPAALLAVAGRVWGQAGEYIPPIPEFAPIGGGGARAFVPHIPWLGGGGDNRIFLLIVATIVVAVVGVALGHALGRRFSADPQQAARDQPSTATSTAAPGSTSVPAMDTLILSASEVRRRRCRRRGCSGNWPHATRSSSRRISATGWGGCFIWCSNVGRRGITAHCTAC